MQSSGTHHYIELAIAIPPRLFESCIAMLSLEGIGYFLEEEERLLAYIPESEWNAEKETSIRSLLENTFGSIPPYRVSFMADRDWNAEWEANLQPIEISDRFLIVQKNREVSSKPGQIVIEINPKMSFGTGYHATTRLMLRQMEQLDLQERKIMDIGTGSGILAIAARKLGNRCPILAFDNNAWAAENAVENIAENRVSSIRVELIDAEEELVSILGEGYDLVLANINKSVIDRILPIIRNAAPQAEVLLSGILLYDEPWLNKLLKRIGYRNLRTIYEDEWLSCLVCAEKLVTP